MSQVSEGYRPDFIGDSWLERECIAWNQLYVAMKLRQSPTCDQLQSAFANRLASFFRLVKD